MSRIASLTTALLVTVACSGAAPSGDKAPGKADTKAAPAAAPVNLEDAGPRGDATKGEELFKLLCVACHQKDGKGMGGAMAADFVNNKVHLEKPDSVLLESIANGVQGAKAAMPPQKDLLNEQERKDVLAYIRKSFGE